MTINPNELILERIRAVEEYDPSTKELTGRYTQIEDPSLSFSAEGTEVLDAMGSTIYTIYKGQKGTFNFTNSLFSLDLAASQFGSSKVVADNDHPIIVPVSEILPINADHTVTLKYTPVGPKGAEIKYVKVLNSDNTFGATYEVFAADSEKNQASDDGKGKFILDAANRKITLPEGAEGRVFVNYNKESTSAVSVAKRADGVPEVKTLLIHAIFHDVCDTNKVLAGTIVCHKAQIDPSSVELTLTAEGKHGASYILQKDYCSGDEKLVDIIVTDDREEPESAKNAEDAEDAEA